MNTNILPETLTARRVIKMKWVLKIFLLLFPLFFVVGFFTGYQHANSPKTLTSVALSHIKPYEDEKNKKFFLIYECQGKSLFKYDVDSNKVEIISSVLGLMAIETLKPAFSISSSEVAFGMITTATAMGYSAKDVINYLNKHKLLSKAQKTTSGLKSSISRQIAKVIVPVVSIVSGYWFGRWVAIKTGPGCDSSKVCKIMGKHKFWKEHELLIWFARWQTCSNLLGRKEYDSIKKKYQPELERLKTERLKVKDYSSEDFIVLADFEKSILNR